VNFAFGYISSSFEVIEMAPGDSKLWSETTALKSQNPSLKVFLSIGGWTFNNPPTQGIFSALAASSSNTNTFIKSALNVLGSYGFDGIDIDWEYPVAEDRGGSNADKDNYVTLLKAIKSAFSPHNYGLSFTSPSSYWYLQNYDLPNMLGDDAADWVNVLTYDLHGVWDSPADFIGSIVLAHTNLTEIEAAFQLYANVGVDPSRMVRIGFYGRSFELVSSSCTDPGCPFAGAAPAGPCSANPGTLTFSEIESIVSSVGTDQLVFDEKDAVKYLVYNDIDWVSYDDAQTFAMKVQFANDICVGGTMHGTVPNCMDSACPVGQTTIYTDYQGDASSQCVGGNERNYCCDTPNAATFSPVDVSDVFPLEETNGDTVAFTVSITFRVDYDENQGTPDDTKIGSGSSGLSDDGKENDSPFSSLFISSPNAESVSSLDLESDWVVADCDATSDQPQTVNAYCTCPVDDEDCGCGHVFLGKATDTIVKMPSSCGLGPYARVVSLQVHPDQTAMSAQFAGRKTDTDPVYSLSFDYAFTDIAEENGPVYMRADMTDMPGYWDAIIDSPPDSDSSLRKRNLNFHQPRGLEYMEKRWFGSFGNWLSKLNTITQSNSASRNFHWSDTYTIFHQEESCPNFQSSLDISVSGYAAVNTQFGYYLEAKIVPPSVQQAYVYFKAAAFTITGVASASWISGRYELVNFGFPGSLFNSYSCRYYPGLLTLGPSLHLYGELTGQISLSGTLKTSVTYTFPNLDLSFGKQDSNAGQSNFGNPVAPTNGAGGFNYGFGWNVQLSGGADVHLIPSLQLGVSVLGGSLINAQVFVEADLYAGVSITGSVSNTVDPNICITPQFGVNLNAGLTGSVLYWQTNPISGSFYSAQTSFSPTCLNSITEPLEGSSRKRFDPYSGDATPNSRRDLDAEHLLARRVPVPFNETTASDGLTPEEAVRHILDKRAVSTIKSCQSFTIPIAAFTSIPINAYFDLANPANLDGSGKGWAGGPPYYASLSGGKPSLGGAKNVFSEPRGPDHLLTFFAASLFIDYLQQFPEVWTDGSNNTFCQWINNNLWEVPAYMPAGSTPVINQIGACYPSLANSRSAGIPVLEQRAK
ncbi:hypothetical protein C8R45DRAFT_818053, partial [Mycena sanguinolenta]